MLEVLDFLSHKVKYVRLDILRLLLIKNQVLVCSSLLVLPINYTPKQVAHTIDEAFNAFESFQKQLLSVANLLYFF